MAAQEEDHRPYGREAGVLDREDSGRSSRISGEFMHTDPKFESPAGSSSSDSELGNLTPPAPLVTLVWRHLRVVRFSASATLRS